MPRFYCTYFDRNYLVRALALIESLKAHEDRTFQLLTVCLDEISRVMVEKLALPNVVCIPLHQIEKNDRELLEVRPSRTLEEYYWTLTPTIILWILEHFPEVDVLTYLDADLYFFSSPEPIFNELGDNDALIHEHRFTPSLSHLEKENGKYNVGLLCFRNNEAGRAILGWWRQRCLEWCHRRFEDGKMGDQMYLNDWTTRFKKVSVLRNIGAGVAPWNHQQYSFTTGDLKRVQVNGLPLVFYHFQSLGIIGPGIFVPAKHTSYPLPETSLRLCYLPYLESLDRAYASVRALLEDFDFGAEGEKNLTRDHTAIVRKELRECLQDFRAPQHFSPLNQTWDCYRSSQIQPSGEESSAVFEQDQELWPSGRKVFSENDLLLELAGQPICQHIKVLYVVGAHLFQEQALLVKLFGNVQKIYLFEPIPELFSSLKAKFQANSMIEVFPFAVSDTNGQSQFYLTNNRASSSLLPLGKHKTLFPHVSVETAITVQTRTLESVMSQYALPPPDMLFLDVQGAESRILSCLSTSLRSQMKLIYTETSKEEVYVGSEPLEQIKSLLASNFSFLGFAPLTNETPTHGNALFANRSSMMFLQTRLGQTRRIPNELPGTGDTQQEWPDSVTRCLETAEGSFKKEDYNAATASLAQALRLFPNNPKLLAAYGNLMLRLGRIKLAISYFVRATVKVPSYAPAHADLAATLLHLRKYNEAEDSACRALALDPNNCDAQAILSCIAGARDSTRGIENGAGHVSGVERSGTETSSSPAAPPNRYLQGFQNYERGDWKTALACFDEVLSWDHKKQGVNFMRGQCLLNLSRLGDAEQAILSELSIKPDHPDARRLLSELRAKRAHRSVEIAPHNDS
jgi:FkbM family methyltransferase